MWIYKITNIHNGKVYVGKTSNVKQRWSEHRRGKHVGAIQNAFKKYGAESFVFDVLEDNIKTDEDLSRLEIYWIARLGSHGSLNGYNMTLGGEGTRFSEEMRAARSGENSWMYGRKHSEETKARWSKIRSGRKLPDWHKAILLAAARKPRSEEARRNMSAAQKLAWSCDERRSALSAAMKGVPKSDAARAAIALAHSKRKNCRMISHNGKTMNMSCWAKESGISAALLRYRLEAGWSFVDAITRPAAGSAK